MKSEFTLRPVEPAKPITISDSCIGCMNCVNNCPIDLFMPPAEGDTAPVVAYPDECWYCGVCVMECPTDAIRLTHPLMNQPRWVAKESLLKGDK